MEEACEEEPVIFIASAKDRETLESLKGEGHTAFNQL